MGKEFIRFKQNRANHHPFNMVDTFWKPGESWKYYLVLDKLFALYIIRTGWNLSLILSIHSRVEDRYKKNYSNLNNNEKCTAGGIGFVSSFNCLTWAIKLHTNCVVYQLTVIIAAWIMINMVYTRFINSCWWPVLLYGHTAIINIYYIMMQLAYLCSMISWTLHKTEGSIDMLDLPLIFYEIVHFTASTNRKN